MIELTQYPRQRITGPSDIKVLVHANSIGAGVGASAPAAYWPAVMNTLPILAGKGITVDNRSIGGMSISNIGATNAMVLTAPTAIDANLHATAHNVLFAHEFINELRMNGRNALNAFNQFKAYCLARKKYAAANGRKLSIVVCTTTPVGADSGNGQAWVDSRMAAIAASNQMIREQYRDFADVLCDVARYEPFNTMFINNIWTPDKFNEVLVYERSDGQPVDLTHLGDAGYQILARAGAHALARVRRK